MQLKLGTFFSALPGLGASAPSGREGNCRGRVRGNCRQIQAKEEVRYDSPGDGFNEGIFAYFPFFLVAFKQKLPLNH